MTGKGWNTDKKMGTQMTLGNTDDTDVTDWH